MNKEKDLDDVFRKGLEDPVDEAGFREEDWAALEQMLRRRKKLGGIVYWLPILGSVAALLLLVLGWWNLGTKTIDHPQPLSHVNSPAKQGHTGTGGGPIRQTIAPKQDSALTAGYAKTPPAGTRSSKSNAFLPQSAAGSRRDTTGQQQVELTVDKRQFEVLSATHETVLASLAPAAPQQVSKGGLSALLVKTIDLSPSKNSKIKSKPVFRPQYAISVIGAPDLNSVGGFSESKVGTNVGLLFSAGVFRKFTLSTGVIYSAKPYNTSFEQYHTPYTFPVTPTNVTADCRMLDIPLDVDYLVYNKHQNKISFGTGLSSYLMVHQNYVFNYAYPYTIGPTNYNVRNNGKYYFGILNLNATYQRQLNSKVGISFQPYLKLPLTNVGYSEVRLQSTGIALGLSWNLNTLTKPIGK